MYKNIYKYEKLLEIPMAKKRINLINSTIQINGKIIMFNITVLLKSEKQIKAKLGINITPNK